MNVVSLEHGRRAPTQLFAGLSVFRISKFRASTFPSGRSCDAAQITPSHTINDIRNAVGRNLRWSTLRPMIFLLLLC